MPDTFYLDLIIAYLSDPAQTFNGLNLWQVVDFVTPYFDEAGISVVMKKPVRDGNLFKFVTVLNSGLWFGIGLVVLVTAVLLWLFDRLNQFRQANPDDPVEQVWVRFNYNV